MSYPLLSVIIPCYNGEKYIEKCINSIKKQSCNNLEILVIDDGSTDNSLHICENIAKTDTRIKVVHQCNQGSSLSRKTGIGIAKGEYITFVDADDWIHPQMYEFMMKGMISENADIAQCGVCNAYLLHNDYIELKHRSYSQITDTYQKFNRVEGVLKILDDKEWQSYMWNKIYKKEVFQNVTFPIGRFLDEDLSVMHQIFHNCRLSIYFNSEFYYYLQGSVTQTTNDKNKAKKIVDRCNARWERYLFTKEHKEYFSMLNKMQNIFISVSIAGLRWAIKHPNYFSQQFIDDLVQRIRNNPLKFNKQMDEYFSFKKKIEYLLIQKMPSFYKILIKHIIV